MVSRKGRSLDEEQEGAAPQMDRPWVRVWGLRAAGEGCKTVVEGGAAPVPEKRLEMEPEGMSGGGTEGEVGAGCAQDGVLDAACPVSGSGGPRG